MWNLPKPQMTTLEVYEKCIENTQGSDKLLLDAARNAVVADSINYTAAASGQNLHNFITTMASNTPTEKLLVSLYERKLSAKACPARSYYDQIKSLSKNDRCPLCGHRAVATLDHFLPKSKYPCLSVTPLNLVPACSDCNHLKSDKIHSDGGKVHFHPYFDDVGDHVWLKAEVVQTAPSSLRYFVQENSNWTAIKNARLKWHFSSLKLATLYSSQSAAELMSIRYHLNKLKNSGGAVAVKNYLQEMSESRNAAIPNSWQTASYTAWGESDWFCDTGFGPTVHPPATTTPTPPPAASGR